jgi:polysaccharide biosynthesis protein PslH
VRVLFLSQIVPFPPHGGVLQRGFNLLRELGQHADVDLVAFVHPDTLPTSATLEESRAELGRFCRSIEYFPLWAKQSPAHKAAAFAVGLASSRPFGMTAHRSPAFAARVAAATRTTRYDIIHVDTIALARFVDLQRPPAPMVLTHHNIESLLMARRAQVEPRWWARAVLRREAAKLTAAERQLSPCFDLNIMMSSNDAAALEAIAPAARTAVVPNGVNTQYFVPAADREAPALIYGGGMNMFANRDAVLYFLDEMWPAIRESHPEIRFFAVGQDPPRELLARAEQDRRIVVTGYVADIREFIAQAAVYVVPLRVGGGTRLKVLDAMAMGKAMVSTSLGCEGIGVKDGEHLLVADTPATFAEATIALLADAPRRLALGRAARDLVERQYSWPVIGRQLLAAYGEAIQARGSLS